MKNYRIERLTTGRIRVVVAPEGGAEYPLRHYAFHSPDGFEAGYGGSGPADLALALLVDHFGQGDPRQGSHPEHDRALQLHHAFKAAFVAGWKLAPGEAVGLTGQQIDAWVKEAEAAQGAAA